MKKLLMSLIICMFLISFASAFEFDNVKSYDNQAKEITFSNSFLGIPTSEIATAKLNTPQINYVMPGKDRLVAEFTITSQEDYATAIKQMQLINNKNGKEIQREVIYKVKQPYYVPVDDFERVCNTITDTKNGSKYTSCENKLIGKHEEERYNYIPLEKLDVQKGEITIGIFTDVYDGDNIEWYPTLFGVKVTEWATWTSSFNVGLLAYYNMNETSGTNVIDQVIGRNITLAGDYGRLNGIIGKSINFDTSAQKGTSNRNMPIGNNNWTVNFWINSSGTFINSEIISWGTALSAQCGKFAEGSGYVMQIGVCGGGSYTYLYDSPKQTGRWEMYTGLWNGTDIIAYRNGSYMGFKTIAGALNVGTAINLTLGASSVGNNLASNTLLDEVGIWNRTLSASEISDLYNNGLGITHVGTSGVYEVNTTLITPINGFTTSTTNLNFSANATYTGYTNLTNMTYYIYHSNGALFNKTTLIPIANISSINITNFTIGTYLWNVKSCATNSTDTYCYFSPSNYSFIFGASADSIVYNNNTYETNSENFYAVYNIIEGSEISQAQLVYNGTNYTISSVTTIGNKIYLNKTIDIPLNPSPFINTTNNFYYRFVYTGNSIQETPLLYQNVSFINLQLCNSTYNKPYINLTVTDEQTGVAVNTSLQANSQYWLGSGSVKKVYNYSDISVSVNKYGFCANPFNYNYQTNTNYAYTNPLYLPREYHLVNATITNVSNNINLLLLNASIGIKFYFTTTIGAGTRVSNALIQIDKFSDVAGTYLATTNRLTDGAGQFVEYLIQDNKYKYTISQNGQLSGILEKTATCTTSPCEITLALNAINSESVLDYYNLIYANNSVSSISFNQTNKLVTYSFTDLTGTAHYYRLEVNQVMYNVTKKTICDSTSYTSSGTITCNMTSYEGDFIATGYLSRSPERIDKIFAFVIDLRNTLQNNPYNLLFLIAWIITLTFGAMAVSRGNPSTILGGFIIAWTSAKLIGFNPFSWVIIVLVDLLALWIMSEVAT